MDRYICIHGHFYQPPRENPWLESIELQDSAYPFHDWNERINSECYQRNAASRILDSEERIIEIVNNYAKISFNFGPTLLSWMEENQPEIYAAILQADKLSAQNFSGHGSALAQAYNHMIMPLANERDKRTQVIWGIRDFQRRFGRDPEGMWLPETAVDTQSLDILAEFGIQFVILAPHQAGQVRPIDNGEWQDVSGARIDPTMPYLTRLPSGRSINLFFYDGPISRAVAFEGLLSKGEYLANRIVGAFAENPQRPQLMHIATDGETYGHHHRFGDMALAYAIAHVETHNLAQITNYGEFLQLHPPTHEAQIIDNTSWSCVHGIERWRSDCGCNSGANPRFKQAWRAPLRETFDWLRDDIAPKYEAMAGEFLKDAWAARDEYIDVVEDRSPQSIETFLSRHASRSLSDPEKVTTLKLLEMQRHAMLIYTSCGWFFDDLSGIETVQVIQYAGRVVQLAQELFGNAIETTFFEKISSAKSNIRRQGDGGQIYTKAVKPTMVDLPWVGAHYAVSSLFEEYEDRVRIYCYDVEVQDYQATECGMTRTAVGRARITSSITLESAVIAFGVSHFGDHNVNAGVCDCPEETSYNAITKEVIQTCSFPDMPQIVRIMDKHFGHSTYSLKSLFRDEQRKVLDSILATTLDEVQGVYRQLYDRHYPMIRFLADLGNPLPRVFHSVAELILNIDLRQDLVSEATDFEQINAVIEESNSWNIELDSEGLSYLLVGKIQDMIGQIAREPNNLPLLEQLVNSTQIVDTLPFEVDLWQPQNQFYDMMMSALPQYQQKAESGDAAAAHWVKLFTTLGNLLWIRVP